MAQKSLFINDQVKRGVSKLDNIRDNYNKFAEGGEIENKEPTGFLKSLIEGASYARSARTNNPGREQLLQAQERDPEEAQQLAKKFTKANLTGIALAIAPAALAQGRNMYSLYKAARVANPIKYAISEGLMASAGAYDVAQRNVPKQFISNLKEGNYGSAAIDALELATVPIMGGNATKTAYQTGKNTTKAIRATTPSQIGGIISSPITFDPSKKFINTFNNTKTALDQRILRAGIRRTATKMIDKMDVNDALKADLKKRAKKDLFAFRGEGNSLFHNSEPSGDYDSWLLSYDTKQIGDIFQGKYNRQGRKFIKKHEIAHFIQGAYPNLPQYNHLSFKYDPQVMTPSSIASMPISVLDFSGAKNTIRKYLNTEARELQADVFGLINTPKLVKKINKDISKGITPTIMDSFYNNRIKVIMDNNIRFGKGQHLQGENLIKNKVLEDQYIDVLENQNLRYIKLKEMFDKFKE